MYDASARSDRPSLNDCLQAGPKFDQDILLKFHVHRVAVTADLEKAFPMVAMAKKDCDVVCFLWFDDTFSDQPNLTNNLSCVQGVIQSLPLECNHKTPSRTVQRSAAKAIVEKLSETSLC